MNQAYPELATHAHPTDRRGEFTLRSPSGFDITTQVVPSPSPCLLPYLSPAPGKPSATTTD